MPSLPTPHLTRPLPDLAAWVACFRSAEIPVLAETAGAIEAMRANEDQVDAHGIAEWVAADPLMTLKLLAHAGVHRPERVITQAETLTAALLLMGIGPFFRAFGPQPTVTQVLADAPAALDGLNEVLERANRSARFALAFAVHRRDHDAAVIHEAALLHDFAEMLLWCHAPALALAMHAAQRADPTLRSADVQRTMLGIELVDLQQALMKVWRLPDLLVRITDDRHAEQAEVRNVMLAVRLARHTAQGWDNAALPDDVADVARLLNLSTGATLALLRDVDH